MNSPNRHSLILLSAIAAALTAPVAFAQDANANVQATPAAQQSTTVGASATLPATPATPATPPMDASGTVDASAAAATPAVPAAPATTDTASTKQLSWTALDLDKDGNLSKSEVSSVKSLSTAFDTAVSNKDGALTTDEYKAYLAAQGSAHAHQG
jgi:hypothetical protein